VERLWSPWRLAYVTGTSDAQGCVFCDAQTSEAAAPLMLFRGHACYVILNLYPYNNGHLMVVPNRHIPSLADCAPAELHEMIDLTRVA
jgi:ATP adenylyltransferase